MIENFFTKISEVFNGQKLPKKIAVALSGGVDSLALTLLLKEFCQKKKIKLFAVTIDHKMRANSSRECFELHKLCVQKEIFHQILELKNNLPQSNEKLVSLDGIKELVNRVKTKVGDKK
jgi:tRNA(Ile)-lysidine synthase